MGSISSLNTVPCSRNLGLSKFRLLNEKFPETCLLAYRVKCRLIVPTVFLKMGHKETCSLESVTYAPMMLLIETDNIADMDYFFDFVSNNKLATMFQQEDPNYDMLEPKHCYGFHRAFTGTSISSIMDSIIMRDNGDFRLPTIQSNPKIAFLFTGQGSQYPKMGQGVYNSCPVFRTEFNKLSIDMESELQRDISNVVYNQNHCEGTSHLSSTILSQTSLFCFESAMCSVWKSLRIVPDMVLGPSAGGFAAAKAAGLLSPQEALQLCAKRAKLINQLPIGGMTCVRVGAEEAQSMISSPEFSRQEDPSNWLDIAVINSPNDVVIAGRLESLEAFENVCRSKGIKYLRVDAAQAFHSRQIDDIGEKYGDILNSVLREKVYNSTTKCQYVSGIDGSLMEKPSDFTPAYFQSHARKPVDLPKAIEKLWDSGVRIFIEVGPRAVLLNDARSILGKEKSSQSLWLPSVTKNDCDWKILMKSLAQLYEAGYELNL